MLKRILLVGLLGLALVVSLWAAAAPVQAQVASATAVGPANPTNPAAPNSAITPTPDPSLGLSLTVPISVAIQPSDPLNTLTFAQLRQDEIFLRGPYASAGFNFGVPADWAIDSGARLVLDLFVSASNLSTAAVLPAGQNAGGTLLVTYNGQTIGTVLINRQGELQETIEIPARAMPANRRDGRYDLALSLDAGLVCEFNQELIIIVRPTSHLIYPHHSAPLVPDLNIFPRPFHQHSVLTDSAILVVPDDPSVGELEAALTVAAGLGNLTSGELQLDLTTSNRLTADQMASSHLIFVGLPRGLRQLNMLDLAIPVSNESFAFPDDFQGDGLIQEAVSPWSPTHMMLVVSGNSESAVIKAARALSTGQMRPGPDARLARVSEVQAEQIPLAIPVDRSLAEMGFDGAIFQRLGVSTVSLGFLVPTGQMASVDAALELNYSFSGLLDFERSSLQVLLNGNPLGSAVFKADTVGNLNHISIAIPASAVLPGQNQLDLRAMLIPRSLCSAPTSSGLWVNVWNDSQLHLPLQALPPQAHSLFDLGLYPLPFSSHPSLGDTAFVLARQDPIGWRAAARLAADLGNLANPTLVGMPVFYGDALPPAGQRPSLIFVGRPTNLPALAEVNAVLPAPFPTGSDVADEPNAQVVYRLPPGANIGYLEIVPAPWDETRAVLTVLGSTDVGLENAAAVLFTRRLRGQLAGDVAIISGERIASGDSRLPLSQAGLLATAVPGGTFAPGEVDLTAAPPAERPTWILAALAGAIGLMLMTFTIMAVQAFRARRAMRKPNA